MPDPWDIPPFPARGDDHEDTTYAGIGRITSRFEEIEVELSYIYSLFVDRPEEMEAIKEYGTENNFHERIGRLVKAGHGYFLRQPNQELEADFDRITDIARKYAARRNDIAHGIVRPFQWITLPSGNAIDASQSLQFCVVPPHYKGKKFDPQDMPIYVYTRRELNALEVAMFHFDLEAGKFKLDLMTDVPPRVRE
jgi:hypothetical protein